MMTGMKPTTRIGREFGAYLIGRMPDQYPATDTTIAAIEAEASRATVERIRLRLFGPDRNGLLLRCDSDVATVAVILDEEASL